MEQKIEQIVFSIVAVFSILISTADWLGLLDNVPFLIGRIPTLTLLVLGLLAGYLVLERRNKLDRIEQLSVDGIERVIKALGGVDVREFTNTQELYEYVVKRMHEAKKSIDDTTWGSAERTRTPASKKAHQKYVEAISTVCTKGRSIVYREVMSFPPIEHLDRAESMLAKSLYNYNLKYYMYERESLPPLFSFMIVDSEEVIIGFYRAPYLPTERERRLAIKHPKVVAIFQDYFDTIWKGAKTLKEGDKTDYTTLQSLKARLTR
jgi:hypothetical protein